MGLEAREGGKIKRRAGGIGYDACNRLFKFDIQEDGKVKKYTASGKKNVEWGILTITFLAINANKGAEFTDIQAIRDEIHKTNPGVHALANRILTSGADYDLEELFNPNCRERARELETSKGQGPSELSADDVILKFASTLNGQEANAILYDVPMDADDSKPQQKQGKPAPESEPIEQ